MLALLPVKTAHVLIQFRPSREGFIFRRMSLNQNTSCSLLINVIPLKSYSAVVQYSPAIVSRVGMHR